MGSILERPADSPIPPAFFRIGLIQINQFCAATPNLKTIHRESDTMFFKLAVVGPIIGLGMAHQCLACYRAKALTAETACAGFGPGCLGFRPIEFGKSDDAAECVVREPA